MVVVPKAPAEPERCTGALVAPDRVLTASHCLSPAMRYPGASCGGVWVAFPAVAEHAGEWLRCERIVRAEPVTDDEVLRQDLAVLQLSGRARREPLVIDPTPVDDGAIVTVVSVTPHPIYGAHHALRARLCRARDPAFATPALGTDAAAVGWLQSCPIEPGNSGSPVLDYEGRVRAVVHGGSSAFFAIGVTSRLQ